jgi:hypothetical protein
VVELGLQEDITAVATCGRAAGVRSRTGAELDLSAWTALREISGDLEIGPTVAIDTVVLDGLVTVGGAIRVANNGSLRGLYFAGLESVGRLEIANNPVLETVSAPRLGSVESELVIADNNALATVLVPSLSGGPVKHRIERNPNLPAEVLEQLGAGSASP